ncbi:hypothetical protein DRJ04_09785 [Candidatus Aerophobetes bacterium]|uniref:Uncharacterized protein n=1 Tax=Aerophobetes bacterium TaxID=2030807 RepID=A0A662D3C7_UNCAE|nr:MAG: hypothetical protein DRJ04_09785 [Candidatus Aerophobetes bacterium]
MFIRKKTFYRQDGTKREYLQIVETRREKDKVRQKVICNLGRLEDLRKGSIDTLTRGLAKFSEKLTVIDAGKDILAKDAKQYGAPLVFRKLFGLTGLEDILEKYLASHNHSFPVKEAVFAMILNRILSPSSKLRVWEWLDVVFFDTTSIYFEEEEPETRSSRIWRRKLELAVSPRC